MGGWRRIASFALGLLLASGFAQAADMPPMKGMPMHAAGQMATKVAGAYRIELHVLPPEDFHTAAEVAAQHLTAGMLVVGGATPRAPDATPPPDHHLIVHVFDRKDGAAVTDAVVKLSFAGLDEAGHPMGHRSQVPVVTMQAIGAGLASTHYGNNVAMPAGRYTVTVSVNGATARFPVKIAP